MRSYRVPFPVYVAAHIRARKGGTVDEEYLRTKTEEFRRLKAAFPTEVSQLSYKYAEPSGEASEEVDVQLADSGVSRDIGPVDGLLAARLTAIRNIALDAVRNYPENAEMLVLRLGEWMLNHTVVRVVGAGRALLAASLPANRLAHGGASIWILGDRSPLPNSRYGGAVIAVSASGKTPQVLDIMSLAQRLNRERGIRGGPEIIVVGLSSGSAEEFQALCSEHCFLGINAEPHIQSVTLRALADIEEYALSELFDALVVAAGLRIGVNFRLGHEDLVGDATGPHHQHA